ncbi:MAG: hypothetical protein LBS30_02090 [Planctomycetota bacterium]|nr:hypothetical protein [Planctomycetota bacterium]
MRGIVLMSATAVILFLASGCDTRNGERYPQEQARASAPRSNLYPLTSPPPGAGQPLQGSAPPARIMAPSNDPSYARAGYGQQGRNPAIVNITTPSPGGVNTYAAMNTTPGYAAPRYAAPLPSPSSLSMAAGYGYDGGRSGLGPYDTSVYGSPSVVSGEAPEVRRSYGRVEGTADIVTTPAAAGLPPPAAPAASAAAYAGGAYPTATATIPATYPPAPVQPQAPAIRQNQAATAVNTAAGAGYGQGEIRLVPAPDVPPGIHPNDAGPSQWFEIIRPGNGPLRIGRVSATCVCVGVRVPNRFIAAGERALVEARILTRPKVNNLTYGIYVNIAEPAQTVVDADVTISL